MERKLKERVVGAALLVLVGVIVIPWLLDGRVAPQEATQPLALPRVTSGAATTKTIVLNAGQAQPGAQAPARARSVSADTDRPSPAARLEAPRPDPPTRSGREPTPSEPVLEALAASPPSARASAAAPPARQAPRTAPADPAVGWAVQVGSFSSQANAQKLATSLLDLGYKSFVSRQVVNGRVMYRVRVGPQRTRADADALAARLKAEKLPVRIVEHPG